MSRRNFSKLQQRKNMARRGSEQIDGGLPILSGPPRKRPSKEDLRKQTKDMFAAVTEITRIFECKPCRFRFRARQAVDPVEPMLCTRCGRPV
ncbi:hypothetical protein [Rhizobium tropici]|uniref:Uncharacterized protein n=1 Tax=Rhizobium tropici TaxID=398 RepID=A0A329YFY3_RHITR|nr:hypothetical protein [Rhizobium tropici]RAX40742.1 hypothetical protein DQ393_15325 [Rhizobium tropici]